MILFLITLLATNIRSAETSRPVKWRLVHEETFEKSLTDSSTSWVIDPLGKNSPWATDHLGDDGDFFHINGGDEFRKQLRSFQIYRKRFRFGENGWLTAELAARGHSKGKPDNPPSLQSGKLNGRSVGLLIDPDSFDGVVIHPTDALPIRYRIEYELVAYEFGGSRKGDWKRGGRINGYRNDGVQTTHPWSWGHDKTISLSDEQWPNVRGANGFYYLAIVDYPNPAPHNNVFIHTHRKVVIDSYNVQGPGGWEVCDPVAKTYSISDDNVLHMFFAIPGSSLESKAVMQTECGIAYGNESGRTQFVGVAKMRPELMPGKTYRFAIERDAKGYTLEASGDFASIGQHTFRYHRDFIAEGRPIWHYNQTPEEYDGSFEKPWTYKGPFGDIAIDHSWPKGSAYPDYFVIGDPHLNYYAGTAAIGPIRLYVPAN